MGLKTNATSFSHPTLDDQGRLQVVFFLHVVLTGWTRIDVHQSSHCDVYIIPSQVAQVSVLIIKCGVRDLSA